MSECECVYIWRSGVVTIAVLWNGGAMNQKMDSFCLLVCTIGARKPGQSGLGMYMEMDCPNS